MELKTQIELAFNKLEEITECNWPNNNRITRDKLIEAHSQLEEEPYIYLGYANVNGLSNVFARAINNFSDIKGKIRNRTQFLLGLVDSFLCMKCKKVYSLDNKDKGKAYNCKSCEKERQKNQRSNGRQFIYDYLKDNECVDCGETNPIVLEFDHRNPDTKEYNVSNMTTRKIEVIQTEIDKCDVVCANCHRIRTAKQQGWYKNINV